MSQLKKNKLGGRRENRHCSQHPKDHCGDINGFMMCSIPKVTRTHLKGLANDIEAGRRK